MKVGILSDTHGLLRPEVFRALEGVEHVLHAGDLGPAELLAELEAIAPVTAVSGNTDGWDVRDRLPEVAAVDLAGTPVVVLHGHRLRTATPEAAVAAHPEAALVVFGHSHQPLVRRIGTTLAVNPGSAGPRRFRDPVTLALAEIGPDGIDVRIVDLDPLTERP